MLVTEKGAGSVKINPLMAAFNAIALMATNPAPHFSQPGIFWIYGGVYRKSSLLRAATQCLL